MVFALNAQNVVHDTIDGEVLAIRSDTGAYYSMRGAAATAWCALIATREPTDLAALVAEHHDADADTVNAALVDFARRLVDEALLIDEAAPGDAPVSLPEETRGEPWGPLDFEKYTDMQDLLLFDPIHEVQPTGWPEVDRGGE